jgi:ABC-2 type transport system permease protein
MGLGSVMMVYLLARGLFGVPFEGSHAVFAFGCVLFLASALTQGMIISILTRKQVLAMQIAMVAGLLPSILLSGFIFPVESMPAFFQYLTMILPARWFMIIARDSFLQTVGFTGLAPSFLALTLITALLVLVGSKKLRKDLE